MWDRTKLRNWPSYNTGERHQARDVFALRLDFGELSRAAQGHKLVEWWFVIVFVVSLTGGLQDFGNSRKAERAPRTVVAHVQLPRFENSQNIEINDRLGSPGQGFLVLDNYVMRIKTEKVWVPGCFDYQRVLEINHLIYSYRLSPSGGESPWTECLLPFFAETETSQ